MTQEYYPGGAVHEESILTTDEFGEEVYVSITQIPELQSDPNHWGDAMVVSFKDEIKGENDD